MPVKKKRRDTVVVPFVGGIPRVRALKESGDEKKASLGAVAYRELFLGAFRRGDKSTQFNVLSVGLVEERE